MTSHFSEYVLEKFLENSIKNVFSRVSFKQFELPNLLPMTMLKTDSSVNVYCLQFFRVTKKASVEESIFGKVMGEISALYNSVENSVTSFGVFREVALEISRNLQFATLLKSYLKLFRNFLENVQMNFVMQFFFSELQALKTTASSLAHFWNSGKLLRQSWLSSSFLQKYTLADSLWNSFTENLQEGLQVD